MVNWQTQIANSTNPSVYYWLFDRTYNCISYGCKVSDNSNNGYSEYAWYVYYFGRMGSIYVDYGELVGIRPVIAVSKKNIQE